jgi:hypothetical protein
MSFDNISNLVTSNISNTKAEDIVIDKNEIKSILYLSINCSGLTEKTEKISIKENHTIDTFA